jgi:Uma2 family endonuclease
MPQAAVHDIAERPDHLFMREDYHAMLEVGILREDYSVELIDGKIIAMMPIGPWHASSSARLNRLLHKLYEERALVSVRNPVGLGDRSEPLPDITVLRRRDDYYVSSHPEPKDVLLIIEISDSTLNYDLNKKRDLYASHGIPEFWVVDGKRRCVHVFRAPVNGAFSASEVLNTGASLVLPGCEGATIAVSETGVDTA